MSWIALFLFYASTVSAQTLQARDLRTGDLLLQSVPCYLCSMIELEEGLPYSHVGIVLKVDETIFVLESWNHVQQISLKQHMNLRKQNSLTLVRRPVLPEGNALQISSMQLEMIFKRDFFGHHYDNAFLWDNRDHVGETYYCSEMVAKLLNRFLPVPLVTKPMHYTRYRKDWIQYFHGTPPDGMPGISPADLARSPLFKTIGDL